MKKLHFPVGIALALATSACAGVGVQTSPSLTSQIAEEQGLGNLWGEPTWESPNGVGVATVRDDSKNSDLWIKRNDAKVETAPEAPVAVTVRERLTLTQPVFGSKSNTSQVLPD